MTEKSKQLGITLSNPFANCYRQIWKRWESHKKLNGVQARRPISFSTNVAFKFISNVLQQSLLNKHHISWSSLIAGYNCGQDMTYCPVVWHKRHKSVHPSWAALDVRPCLGATKKSQLRPRLDKWNNLAAGQKLKTSAYYTDKMGRQVQEDIYTTFLWRIFNNKSMQKENVKISNCKSTLIYSTANDL